MDVTTLFGVDGKVVLVTGGGRGVGKMIASGFVANGARVYIASRNLAACEQTAQELTAKGPGQCIAIAADLASEEGCRRLADELGKREQHLDVLVNNSGMSWPSGLSQHTSEGWDQVLGLNLKSPFFLTRELLPLLDQAATSEHGARVIMIGSIAGLLLLELPTYAYHTSKAALHHLTRQLAAHLAKRPNGGRILVNAIGLGFVPTDMSRKSSSALGASIEERGAALPLARCGSPRDLAGAAIFLASAAASWITGTLVVCDGGHTMAKL